MNLSSHMSEDMHVLTVEADRIDAAVAIQFKDSLRSATENGPARVVLDLSQVQFLDSSGLGAVVGAMKALGQNRKLELAALQENVAKVFHLTRMDRVFTIHDTVPAGRPLQ